MRTPYTLIIGALLLLSLGTLPDVSAFGKSDVLEYFSMGYNISAGTIGGWTGSMSGRDEETSNASGVFHYGREFQHTTPSYVVLENDSFSNAFDGNNDWCISYWVYPYSSDSSSDYHISLRHDRFLSISDNENGVIDVAWKDDGTWYALESYDLPVEEWVHVVVSWDSGNNITLYINGAWVNNSVADSINEIEGGNKKSNYLGTDDTATGEFFHGVMDEVLIVGSDICTVSNISMLYNEGSGHNIFEVGDDVHDNRAEILNLSLKVNRTDKYNITNNTTVEFLAGNYAFRSYANETPLLSSTIKIVSDNGSTIINSGNLSVNLNWSYFVDFDGNPFYVTVWANDTGGNTRIKNYSFWVVDSYNPTASGINNVDHEGGDFVFNVTFEDEHFFSFNVSCTNGFSDYVEGLNVQSYNYVNTTSINTTTTCSWQYCDGHTASRLRDRWDYLTTRNSVRFRQNNEKEHLLRTNTSVVWNVSEGRDRLRFKVTLPNVDPRSREWHVLNFTFSTSGRSVYVPSEEFPAWIVDVDNKVWFDLRSGDVSEVDIPERYRVKVFRISENSWNIMLGFQGASVEFESIGELNCVSREQSISVEGSTSFGWVFGGGSEFTTLQQGMFYFFLFLVWITLFISSLVIRGTQGKRMGMLSIAQLIVGLTFGATVIQISLFLSVAVWFLSVMGLSLLVLGD